MSSPDVHATGHFFHNRNWIDAHFRSVPNEIANFFEGDGISLQGAKILDIGTGDGLIALGLTVRANCTVIGIDPLALNIEWLKANAPLTETDFDNARFSFFQAPSNDWSFLPGDFDFAISWSAGEHFENFSEVTHSIHRALKPGGKYFFQTYPLWKSRWGHHLFEWVPEFFHIGKDVTEIYNYLENLRQTPKPLKLNSGEESDLLEVILEDRMLSKENWLQLCVDSLNSCNQMGLDEMLSLIEVCGFKIAKAEYITGGFHLPPNLPFEVSRGIEGVKLIANRL